MVDNEDCRWWQLQSDAEQRNLAGKDPKLKKYCKTPKVTDMIHETLHLYDLNIISSWNIALTVASFQSCSEQCCSFLAANLAQLCKILEKCLSRNLNFNKQRARKLIINKVNSLANIRILSKNAKMRKNKTRKTRKKESFKSLKQNLSDPQQKFQCRGKCTKQIYPTKPDSRK